ncbi:hypothetical protein C4J81_17870 [Deltaproteobacteria bacterium Smac51]|nr:hypothetical protein C4J81_17870 [Deltaproteobacteria bacterium Smac51]
MADLIDIVKIISRESGWREKQPEADGRVRYDLENGPVLEIFTPDHQSAVFLSTVAQLPPTADTDEACRGMARLASAVFSRRRSVLSYRDGVFSLHQSASLKDTPDSHWPEICASFLDDCDWWREQAVEAMGEAAPAFSAFGGLRP